MKLKALFILASVYLALAGLAVRAECRRHRPKRRFRTPIPGKGCPRRATFLFSIKKIKMKRLIFYTLACLALNNGPFGQSLPANAMEVHPLPIGAMVPDIGVVSATGESADMKSILNGMPTVLVFYRGGWCPYCNRQLADLALVEKDLKEMGYQVVAVSPDVPERLRESQGKGALGYRLFSDASGKLIRAMGLGYKVPENYREIVRKASDGQNEDLLPAPAVFLVDGQGKISFSYMNTDFRQRLSGEALVQAAKKFRGQP